MSLSGTLSTSSTPSATPVCVDRPPTAAYTSSRIHGRSLITSTNFLTPTLTSTNSKQQVHPVPKSVQVSSIFRYFHIDHIKTKHKQTNKQVAVRVTTESYQRASGRTSAGIGCRVQGKRRGALASCHCHSEVVGANCCSRDVTIQIRRDEGVANALYGAYSEDSVYYVC